MKNKLLREKIKTILFKYVSPSTNDSIDTKEAIDQLVEVFEEEKKEIYISLKYNVIGLFPINRTRNLSAEETIDLLHAFLDLKLNQLTKKKKYVDTNIKK